MAAALDVSVVGRNDESGVAVVERLDDAPEAGVDGTRYAFVLLGLAAPIMAGFISRRQAGDEQAFRLCGEERNHLVAGGVLPGDEGLGIVDLVLFLVEFADVAGIEILAEGARPEIAAKDGDRHAVLFGDGEQRLHRRRVELAVVGDPVNIRAGAGRESGARWVGQRRQDGLRSLPVSARAARACRVGELFLGDAQFDAVEHDQHDAAGQSSPGSKSTLTA
ncbi:MAG: hypothetical protein R2724_26605 [Bryobacterales bacterium]